MRAVDIVIGGVAFLDENHELEIIQFVMDNPSYHQSIIENEGSTFDILHDIFGLMRDDKFFLPRVLTKNK